MLNSQYSLCKSYLAVKHGYTFISDTIQSATFSVVCRKPYQNAFSDIFEKFSPALNYTFSFLNLYASLCYCKDNVADFYHLKCILLTGSSLVHLSTGDNAAEHFLSLYSTSFGNFCECFGAVPSLQSAFWYSVPGISLHLKFRQVIAGCWSDYHFHAGHI